MQETARLLLMYCKYYPGGTNSIFPLWTFLRPANLILHVTQQGGERSSSSESLSWGSNADTVTTRVQAAAPFWSLQSCGNGVPAHLSQWTQPTRTESRGATGSQAGSQAITCNSVVKFRFFSQAWMSFSCSLCSVILQDKEIRRRRDSLCTCPVYNGLFDYFAIAFKLQK